MALLGATAPLIAARSVTAGLALSLLAGGAIAPVAAVLATVVPARDVPTGAAVARLEETHPL